MFSGFVDRIILPYCNVRRTDTRLPLTLHFRQACIMPDKFDPYREALIVETETLWPAEYAHLDAVEKARIEMALHENPEPCQITYERMHTGFIRIITVTEADVERVGAGT
jgi:hypothetical protein